jgi:hypothetical protein
LIPHWLLISIVVLWIAMTSAVFLEAIWNAVGSVVDAKARLERIQFLLLCVVMLGVVILAMYFFTAPDVAGRHV